MQRKTENGQLKTESDHQKPVDPPIINLVGEKIALGPLDRAHLPLHTRWVNDFEISGTMATPIRPMTPEGEREWFDRATANLDDRAHFAIYARPELRPIGSCGLRNINHLHGTAELGIAIGERDCWSKGYGSEAVRLLVRYGFEALGLHNIVLRVYAFNPRAIRAYEKCGFREIGRRREAVRNAGRVGDEIYMDCVASDFDPQS